MSNGVQFEEDNFSFTSPNKTPGAKGENNVSVGYGHPQYNNASVPRGMAGWLMRHGLATSSSTAQVILVGIVIVNIIITYFVIRFFL